MGNFGKKAAAAVMAGLMAVSAVAPAGVAIAETVDPSVGYSTDTPGQNGVVNGHQTGTGVTDITVQYKQTSQDVGGAGDPTNPDTNPQDGLGDNIAFTVPTAINFVADAQGNLTGPSAEAAYIENESTFSIHASAFQTSTANGWTIVDDDTTTTTADAIDFQFGPRTAKAENIDAYDYLEKTKISDVAEDAPYVEDWNMASKATDGVADRVQLHTTGNIHNVSRDISEQTKVAEIHTYVSAGNARAQQQQP